MRRRPQRCLHVFESGDIDPAEFFGGAQDGLVGNGDPLDAYFAAIPDYAAPIQRRFFEPLVNAFDAVDGGVHESVLQAASGVFGNNGVPLTDRYTQDPADTELFAQFLDQAVFDPRSPSSEATREAFAEIGQTYFDRLANADNELEGEAATRQMGHLYAALTGGGALALERYDRQVAEREATIGRIADTVGIFRTVSGARGASLPDPIGLTGRALTDLTRAIADGVLPHPERPGVALQGVLKDEWTQVLLDFQRATGTPDVLTDFDAAYSAELLQLQAKLNVNLGAHSS